MKLSNFSLAAKLWTALVVVIALLAVTLGVATLRGNALNAKLDAAAAVQSAKISKITRWVGLIETNVTRMTASVISPDSVIDDLYKEQIAATISQITEIQKSIDAMELGVDGKALFSQIGEDRKVVLASLVKAREAKKSGDQDAAVQEIKSIFLPAVDKYIRSLQQFSDLQARGFEAMQTDFVQQRLEGGRFAQVMVAILIAILIGGTILLIRQIREPLRDAITVAETIANGDLSGTIDVSRGDEFGEMMRAIAHMQERLVHLVSDVRQGTDDMAHVSEEIESGNHDLSKRTEQSAASLEETASSMQELTANVKQSADSARQANQLAGSAAQVAQRGGQVVGQVVTTMDEINASSRKISDIISVIDGIAFQTNILALNAAVEAARAGEQGRGFAVVASEVRSLAGRSADAAKEIKQLINTSVQKVEGGSALVAQAGETMTEIVNSVQKVTDIMGGITTAAAEQSDGIAQVNSAVAQLDQMTQQNAALVEQSAAAASSMKDQAHRLAGLVATFKLDGNALSVRPSAPMRQATFSPPKALASRPAPKALSAPAKRLAAPAKPASATAKAPIARKTAPVLTTKASPALASRSSAKASGSKGDDDWETF
jgi:methyl-accepting chemotaxis protein